MRALQHEELELVHGGWSSDVDELTITGTRPPPSDWETYVPDWDWGLSDPELSPPLEYAELGIGDFDPMDLAKLLLGWIFGDWIDIQQRDETSKYDREKIVKRDTVTIDLGNNMVVVNVSRQIEADGTYWFDLDNDNHPETHVKDFADGAYYDSNNDGTFDTKVNWFQMLDGPA